MTPEPIMRNGHANREIEHHSDGGLRDEPLLDCDISELHYGKFKAVRDVAVKLPRGTITAFIGLRAVARVQSCAA
jgi:ABC-type uncharacterized transport system ATPase subunit